MRGEKPVWTEWRVFLLVVLTALASGILLISNLAAVKLWDFWGIAVDGGVVIFPLSYILGDLVMEVFGRKIGRQIIWVSFGVNILAVIVFLLVGFLPEFPEWRNQAAYLEILGFVPRIVVGSLMAYVCSGLINNLIFEKIRNRTGGGWLAVRTLGSSVIARFFDVIIFEVVAFLGVLPFHEFCKQVIFAYVLGIILEFLLTPLTYLAVNLVNKKLN